MHEPETTRQVRPRSHVGGGTLVEFSSLSQSPRPLQPSPNGGLGRARAAACAIGPLLLLILVPIPVFLAFLTRRTATDGSLNIDAPLSWEAPCREARRCAAGRCRGKEGRAEAHRGGARVGEMLRPRGWWGRELARQVMCGDAGVGRSIHRFLNPIEVV